MNKKQSQEIPLSEWIVAGLGVVFVAAILFMLVRDAFNTDDAPPTIVVAVDSTIALPRSWLVEISATNESGRTAAAVVVEGVLADESGAEVERSETTIDYLPPHSKQAMGLYFSRDPRKHRLSVRAVSYQHP
jgi:uncharacterized protein (TIGR02588 family)